MDAATLQALEGSIDKWRRIVQEGGEDHGSSDCPLCHLFRARDGDCAGCPVEARTGYACCTDTPYDKWIEARDDALKYSRAADTPEKLAAARAELNFLRSLLPKKEKP